MISFHDHRKYLELSPYLKSGGNIGSPPFQVGDKYRSLLQFVVATEGAFILVMGKRVV